MSADFTWVNLTSRFFLSAKLLRHWPFHSAVPRATLFFLRMARLPSTLFLRAKKKIDTKRVSGRAFHGEGAAVFSDSPSVHHPYSRIHCNALSTGMSRARPPKSLFRGVSIWRGPARDVLAQFLKCFSLSLSLSVAWAVLFLLFSERHDRVSHWVKVDTRELVACSSSRQHGSSLSISFSFFRPVR